MVSLVGNSLDARTQIFDEEGRIRPGVVVIKLVNNFGPYGYRVHYQRGTIGEGHHVWEYLGLAEPGLSTGNYAPGTPLKFYRGRQKKLQDKRVILVGNWDTLRFSDDLDSRLENVGYLEEVIHQ